MNKKNPVTNDETRKQFELFADYCKKDNSNLSSQELFEKYQVENNIGFTGLRRCEGAYTTNYTLLLWLLIGTIIFSFILMYCVFHFYGQHIMNFLNSINFIH